VGGTKEHYSLLALQARPGAPAAAGGSAGALDPLGQAILPAAALLSSGRRPTDSRLQARLPRPSF
jgi:hypothetical protein